MIRDLELRCDTALKESYQRNNKRGGLKNLRCFPTCHGTPPTHRRGFCGQPIAFSVSYCTQNIRGRIHTFGRFEQADAPPRYAVGSALALSEAEAKTKTVSSPQLPLYRGKCASFRIKGANTFASFLVNSEQRCYHYGWISNKHRAATKHVMRLYLFEELNGQLLCRAFAETKTFDIVCRRRAPRNDGTSKVGAKSATAKDAKRPAELTPLPTSAKKQRPISARCSADEAVPEFSWEDAAANVLDSSVEQRQPRTSSDGDLLPVVLEQDQILPVSEDVDSLLTLLEQRGETDVLGGSQICSDSDSSSMPSSREATPSWRASNALASDSDATPDISSHFQRDGGPSELLPRDPANVLLDTDFAFGAFADDVVAQDPLHLVSKAEADTRDILSFVGLKSSAAPDATPAEYDEHGEAYDDTDDEGYISSDGGDSDTVHEEATKLGISDACSPSAPPQDDGKFAASAPRDEEGVDAAVPLLFTPPSSSRGAVLEPPEALPVAESFVREQFPAISARAKVLLCFGLALLLVVVVATPILVMKLHPPDYALQPPPPGGKGRGLHLRL